MSSFLQFGNLYVRKENVMSFEVEKKIVGWKVTMYYRDNEDQIWYMEFDTEEEAHKHVQNLIKEM